MATVIDRKDIILGLKFEAKGVKDATNQVDKIEKSTDSLKGKLSTVQNVFKNLIQVAVIAKGIQLLTNLGRAATNIAADAEQTKLQFNQLIGNAAKTEEILQSLDKFSLATPFDPITLQNGTKGLLNYGVATDDVLDATQRLGELSLGNADKFLALTDAYGKANARVKVTNETLELFANNGVPILDILAKKLNTSKEEIIDLASKGQINFNILKDAIKDATDEGGKFFGALQKQSQSLTGLRSTLKGVADQILKVFGERNLERIKSVTRAAISLATSFLDFIKIPLSEKIREEQSELNILVQNITDVNTSQKDRNRLISELQEKYPGYLGNLNAETVTNEQLRDRLNEVNKAYVIKIALQQQEEKLTELTEKASKKLVRAFDLEQKARQKLTSLLGNSEANRLTNNRSIQDAIDLALLESGVTDELIKTQRGGINVLTSRQKALLELSNTLSQSNIQTSLGNEIEDESLELRKSITEFTKRYSDELGLYNEIGGKSSTVTDNLSNATNKLTKDQEKAIKVARELSSIGIDSVLSELDGEVVDFKLAIKAEEEAQTKFISDLQAKLDLEAINLTIVPKVEPQDTTADFGDLSSSIDTQFNTDIFNLTNEDKEKIAGGGLSISEIENILTERNSKIQALELQRLKDLKDAAFESGDTEEFKNLTSDIFDFQIGQAQRAAQAQEDYVNQVRELYRSLYSDVTNFANDLLDNEISNLDKSIDAQNDRVDKAAKAADKGNAEALDRERDRLSELAQERENFVKTQEALQKAAAQAQIVINTAQTISNIQLGAARVFAETGVAAPVALPIILAILGGLFQTAGNIFSVPAFKDGTEYVNGAGTSTSDSIHAKLSKGERVVRASTNAKLLKAGITNDHLDSIGDMLTGNSISDTTPRSFPSIRKEMMNIELNNNIANEATNKEIRGLRADVSELKQSFERQRTIVKIDKDGINAIHQVQIDKVQYKNQLV